MTCNIRSRHGDWLNKALLFEMGALLVKHTRSEVSLGCVADIRHARERLDPSALVGTFIARHADFDMRSPMHLDMERLMALFSMDRLRRQ